MELEKQIFTDVFNFLKLNYSTEPKDQAYWAVINEQLATIEQKYLGNKFAVDMLYACTKRLCELCDEQKKEAIRATLTQ